MDQSGLRRGAIACIPSVHYCADIFKHWRQCLYVSNDTPLHYCKLASKMLSLTVMASSAQHFGHFLMSPRYKALQTSSAHLISREA